MSARLFSLKTFLVEKLLVEIMNDLYSRRVGDQYNPRAIIVITGYRFRNGGKH